jgi:cytochrome c2
MFTRTPVNPFWQFFTRPAVATTVHGAAIWIWHAPRLYDATLASDWMHAAQHASFIGTALLFWWALLHGRSRRAGYGAGVLYLFFTAVHTTLLGVLLFFADKPWYPAYSASVTSSWGVTPLQDQQIGGLIMWIPAGIAYLVGGLVLFAGWLRESEVRVISRETAARAATVLVLLALFACRSSAEGATNNLTGGDSDRGKVAIRNYGCGSCHSIPGVRGANARVGPDLNGIAGRSYIAGVLSNSPEHMMQWIENPQAIDSKTAMPNMGVTERDARDIAAYLYTLR